MLKQPVNSPIPVQKQVCILYALVSGFLDDVEIGEIGRFEWDLYEFLDSHHPEVLTHISETSDLPDRDELDGVIGEFKEQFVVYE